MRQNLKHQTALAQAYLAGLPVVADLVAIYETNVAGNEDIADNDAHSAGQKSCHRNNHLQGDCRGREVLSAVASGFRPPSPTRGNFTTADS